MWISCYHTISHPHSSSSSTSCLTCHRYKTSASYMCKVTRTSFVVHKETIFIILKHSPQANMVNISGWIVYLDLETVKQNIIRQSAHEIFTFGWQSKTQSTSLRNTSNLAYIKITSKIGGGYKCQKKMPQTPQPGTRLHAACRCNYNQKLEQLTPFFDQKIIMVINNWFTSSSQSQRPPLNRADGLVWPDLLL